MEDSGAAGWTRGDPFPHPRPLSEKAMPGGACACVCVCQALTRDDLWRGEGAGEVGLERDGVESELKDDLWARSSGPGFEFHLYCHPGACLYVAMGTDCTATSPRQ